jgi:putative ABC transport system substrate-binding protein
MLVFGEDMKRRDFLRLAAGGVGAAFPAVARAQSAKFLIGYLSVQATAERPDYVAAFHNGLAAQGFVEGQNLTIEYRAADGQAERLPGLAADLVRRGVAAIATSGGPPAALAAKRATETIPVVFASGGDPVQLGLVSNFSRPDKNLTGLYFLFTDLVAKRLALLHELLPKAKRVALLVNPSNPAEAEPTVRNATAAARELDLDVKVFNANLQSMDGALADLLSWRADAIFVGPDPSFSSQPRRLVDFEARHALPASYFIRNFVEAGGLMSYGPDAVENQTQLGIYIGRILKGEKPRDLPVVQPTKYDLVINLKTAKALAIEVPAQLLARTDQVIE